MDLIDKINKAISDVVWVPPMIVLLGVTGILMTILTRFFQISHFGYWMKNTIGGIFRKKHVTAHTKDKSISQFQSLCTALAATVGTVNIVGVAGAIATGGPGAVFWMWLSAFLGMMTNYAENTLGIKYRYRNEKGDWIGGAMIYIERGLHCRWLAVTFSVFCFLASFGIGNMTQANSIASGLKDSFGVPAWATAVVIMIFVALVIVGGIKRIASVTEKMVPFMAILYILGGIIVIICNAEMVPEAFRLIFTEAFNFQAAGGGVLGYGIATAMKRGISRGVFSNEAGLGSSVMVHSASDVEEPVIHGMWGVFEVFADTIVVCTITCLTILTSGVYDMEAYLTAIAAGGENAVVSGTSLTASAFATVIPHGDKFVALAIMMFAFSTLLGWSYYGERAVEYLFGIKGILPYKVIFVAMIFLGCTGSLTLVWDIADTLNGFMAVPNLIAVTFLSGEVIQMTKVYLEKKERGV